MEVAALSPRPEVFLAHGNARLTLRGRHLLIKRVVTGGRPVAHVVTELGCSRATAYKRLARWRAEGDAGLHDPCRADPQRPAPPRPARSSAVTNATGPANGPTPTPRRIGRLRAGRGRRVHGRDSLERRQSTSRHPGRPRIRAHRDRPPHPPGPRRNPPRENATCAGFLHHAAQHFAALSIDRIQRVMTDTTPAYRRGHTRHDALTDLGAQTRSTRRCRPQPNGKAERLNRTTAEE